MRAIKPGLLAATLSCVLPAYAVDVDFDLTTDADFDMGVLDSLNHDAPNNDQLQVDTETSTFPLLWIANGGEDTVSKIDVNGGPDGEGCEEARYQTWFGPVGQPGHIPHLGNPFTGPAPSRTAVDKDGNVYVANRHFGRVPGVMKILSGGGIDRNGNGVIDTSKDLNGDCQISTNPADGEILPIADTNGNGILEPDELLDERVAWYANVGTSNQIARSLCIAPGGNVWVGMFQLGQSLYEISPVDGSGVSGPHANGSVQKYGCVILANGVMYSATLSNTMHRFDTVTKTDLGNRVHSGSNYGITTGNGKVYLASNAGSHYNVYDPATDAFTFVNSTDTRGIGVDSAGNIFVGRATLQKFNSANVSLGTQSNNAGGADQRGVIVDANQAIWMVNKNANSVTKISNDLMDIKILPVGNQPYTYSDATGQGFRLTNPFGTWRIVRDAGAGAVWNDVAWNTEPGASEPPDTSTEVEVRVADTVGDLDLQPFVPVANGAMGLGLAGQFLEARVTLTPDADGVSPVFTNLQLGADIPTGPCDFTDDGQVDINDIQVLLAARNQLVPPADPALDIDGDGKVTVLDARQCVLLCTNARCVP